MKNVVYFVMGFIFAVGLTMSRMLDPESIKKFLWVAYPEVWSPALLIVLSSAVFVYAVFYWSLVKGGKTVCGTFSKSPQGKIDRKLLLGSVIFGVGWGLSGLCPAPAVARIGLFPFDLSTWLFVALMFLGFKLEAIVSWRLSKKK